LKYLSSIYVFVMNPAQHEGALHIARQRIISNRSLLQNATRVGLPQFIQAKPFTVKPWQPPNFAVLPNNGIVQSSSVCSIEGDENNAEDEHVESDAKDTADPGAAEPSAQPTVQADTLTETVSVTPAADGAAGSQPSAASRSKRRAKKKRQQDEQNNQWLGDKVPSLVLRSRIPADLELRLSRTLRKPSSELRMYPADVKGLSKPPRL